MTRPDDFAAFALHVVVSKLEAHEQQRRAADAAQIRLFAEAFDAATLPAPRLREGLSADACDELVYRTARAEMAAALRISEQAVERRMQHARILTMRYPDALRALETGAISERHTVVIAEAGLVIGQGADIDTTDRYQAYERAVLAVAVNETPNRLRPVARQLAEQYAEVPLDERHEIARARRCVMVTDRGDGMADLIAHLPAVEAYGVYDRLTRMAKYAAQHSVAPDGGVFGAGGAGVAGGAGIAGRAEPDDARSRDEWRADLLADILVSGLPEELLQRAARACNGSAGDSDCPADQRDARASVPESAEWVWDLRPGIEAIRANVRVTVREETLLAMSSSTNVSGGASIELAREVDPEAPLHEPPVLVGYGPISSHAAGMLASGAPYWSMTREGRCDGVVLAVERYRPSERMRRYLAVRDERCRFPGCRAPVNRCDIDHTIDAQFGGETSTLNLAHLCRGHHVLKHHGGWRVEQHPDGDLEWSSPTGRRYRDRPPSRVRFVAHEAARRNTDWGREARAPF